MAFAIKIDYCDLVNATKVDNAAKVEIRDSNRNGTVEKYQPTGQNGDFDGTDIFGGDSAPTNKYGLLSGFTSTAGMIKLNKITSITTGSGASAVTKKYALESVKITTQAGSPVSIDATCQEVEDGAADVAAEMYWIPVFALSTKFEAQDIFGAFTLGGQRCHLTGCTMDIGCKIGKDDVAGVKISSYASEGVITVSGTILSTAGNLPTVTAKAEAVSLGNSQTSNWVVTMPPETTEQNPEKAAKQYTFELQLPLKKAGSAQAPAA